MQQPARTRFAVVMVAIAAVSLGVAYLLLHLIGPSDGSRLAPGEPVWRSDGVIVTPIQEQSSGLQKGDVVIAVEGSSIESWAQALLKPGLARPQWHAGQTISYNVLRNGHRLDVPVTLEPYPLGASLIHEWSTVLFALVFPEAHPVVAKRPWTIPFIYIIPFAFSFVYLAIAWPRSVSTLDWISNWDLIESILPAVYLVLTIVIVIWSYRILRTTADRQKIRWLMFAALVSGGDSASDPCCG